ncbi:peptidylprolyl isomerase PrsA [Streptococcus cuniculipharyngis]|uniref:Foldase protein PrsA n=1 Tax=Streptococcus cuniculipharyngis TaxID=1562651 RepID=A0A5C5SGC8_9STRE|nr:peptidylprolyl isomerase PrsA [Streptococcus cuniculipharyngis]TWS99005.1 peptidylprolyl isomerase PrsA [Streptococcus cuniculipharyngis]
MKKKFAAGLVTLLSVATLAACSNSKENTSVVTMKGDTITVSDFYEQVKTSTAAQQSMLTLVLSRVFEAQYGDKVSDKEVTEAYNKTAESYGASFSQALTAAGMTTDSYKQTIRLQKLIEYAVNKEAEKALTDENYKKAYDSYTPEVSAQIIKLSDEAKAKSVLEQVRAEGADFAAIAKENSTDSTVDYSFDSASTNLPADVKNAAFGLGVDSISEVLTVLDNATYTTNYYIVKVTKKTEKAADWKTYKDQLKKIILAEQTADGSLQKKIITEALQKANVKVKDQAFAGILSQFALSDSSSSTVQTSDSSSSAASTEASSESSASESSDSSSSEAESSSSAQ